jgi:diguanylate cyclase (GGDEF)-like protein
MALAGSGAMSILLAIQSYEERNQLQVMLRQAGYQDVHLVASASDAAAALGIEDGVSRSVALGVELIVIDLDSPGCYDTCQRIKNHLHYQDVPIIGVLGKAAPETIHQAFAYGVADYLTRPWRDFEFLARIRANLRLKYEIDRRKAREKELLEAARQLSDLNVLLTRASLVDSLTGTANRRWFDRALDQEWRRAFRSRKPVSVIMIDVDYFKAYNDAYGHQEGDRCLQRVSEVIRQAIKRPGDLLCRYGGEEFAVILPETPLEGAEIVAQMILASVVKAGIPHRASGSGSIVTLSMGVAALVPSTEAAPASLVACADKALYAAKTGGRNRVERFEGEPGEAAAPMPEAG